MWCCNNTIPTKKWTPIYSMCVRINHITRYVSLCVTIMCVQFCRWDTYTFRVSSSNLIERKTRLMSYALRSYTCTAQRMPNTLHLRYIQVQQHYLKLFFAPFTLFSSITILYIYRVDAIGVGRKIEIGVSTCVQSVDASDRALTRHDINDTKKIVAHELN